MALEVNRLQIFAANLSDRFSWIKIDCAHLFGKMQKREWPFNYLHDTNVEERVLKYKDEIDMTFIRISLLKEEATNRPKEMERQHFEATIKAEIGSALNSVSEGKSLTEASVEPKKGAFTRTVNALEFISPYRFIGMLAGRSKK